MHFNMKYTKSSAFIPVSFDEKVKRFSDGKFPKIKIHYVIVKNGLPSSQQYHFTLLVPSSKIIFNISPFLESLERMPYNVELKQLEAKVDLV